MSPLLPIQSPQRRGLRCHRSRVIGKNWYLPHPEGNAHQAEFTADNRFIIGTDEDFSPYRALLTTNDGGEYAAAEFS